MRTKSWSSAVDGRSTASHWRRWGTRRKTRRGGESTGHSASAQREIARKVLAHLFARVELFKVSVYTQAFSRQAADDLFEAMPEFQWRVASQESEPFFLRQRRQIGVRHLVPHLEPAGSLSRPIEYIANRVDEGP